MNVFLAERFDETKNQLEPVGVFSTREFAEKHITEGIITELELDKAYPEGAGSVNHWHYPLY